MRKSQHHTPGGITRLVQEGQRGPQEGQPQGPSDTGVAKKSWKCVTQCEEEEGAGRPLTLWLQGQLT